MYVSTKAFSFSYYIVQEESEYRHNYKIVFG
jgi:hypothetical protein